MKIRNSKFQAVDLYIYIGTSICQQFVMRKVFIPKNKYLIFSMISLLVSTFNSRGNINQVECFIVKITFKYCTNFFVSVCVFLDAFLYIRFWLFANCIV